ncbi:MATE family efflux transporter [Enterococcus sp. LJL128]
MEQDLTFGHPIKKILWFTIPIFIGNLFQQFYNFADTMIVGRLLGVNELAAVGATGSLMFVVLGFTQGCGAGFSIILSQYFGSKDEKKVKEGFAVSIFLSLVIAVIVTIVSFASIRPLLQFMQTPTEIMSLSYDYLSIIYLGSIAAFAFNLLSNMLRALGDSKTPLYFLILACILNIFLDWFLIRVIPMGVGGAAVATVIAQGAASIACIIYIGQRFPLLKIKKRDFKLERSEIKKQLTLGIPMGFQYSIIGLGQVALQYSLNLLGTAAVAAYTAAGKIEFFSSMSVQALGTALATFAGQNFGAGKIERIRYAFRKILWIALGIAVFMGAINWFLGDFLIALFVSKSETTVINLGVQVLQANGLSYWLLAILFICRFTLQGLGKSVIPTVSGIMELVSRFITAFILSKQFGFFGITLANPLAWLLAAIPLAIACYVTLRNLKPSEELSSMDYDGTLLD